MPRKFLSAALAAGLSIAAFAPAAMAGTAQLRIGDLDLASDVGKIQLNSRIQRAATAACTIEIQAGKTVTKSVNPGCVNETRVRLEQQVAAMSTRYIYGG